MNHFFGDVASVFGPTASHRHMFPNYIMIVNIIELAQRPSILYIFFNYLEFLLILGSLPDACVLICGVEHVLILQ